MPDVPLSAFQRSKIRRLARPETPDPGEGGELNVVPYLDIVMNVVMFVLGSLAVVFVSVIDTKAAGATGVRPEPSVLSLTAIVTQSGVALKTADGHVAPGCSGVGAGVTVARRDGAIDAAGVMACARHLKDAFPMETEVTLTASPGIEYSEIITVMDALRRDPEGDLFPVATLAVAR